MAARKQKNTVDYFPHLIRGGKTMFIIESKYKNDGYATWFKILERLGTSENHFIDLSDNKEIMYLASTCNINEDLLNSIINDLVDLGKFDKDLWNHNIIWSQDFVDNISDLYQRRKSEIPTKELIYKHLKVKYDNKSLNDDKSSHSIVKDSIVEDRIVEDSKLKEEYKAKKKEKEEKNPLHSQCVKIYFDWYKKMFDMEPQFDGSDGKAMNNIINYLKKNVKKNEGGAENGVNEELIIKSWEVILGKYNSWDKFYRKQRRVRQIESNLSNLINNIRHGTQSGHTESELSEEIENFLRERGGKL